jgi:GAF domain-containing protein
LDCGRSDRYRRGFTGLSAAAQTVLEQNPYSGHVFVFRGRRGDLVGALVRWRRAVFICETARTRALRLAAGGKGNGLAQPSAAFDAAGNQENREVNTKNAPNKSLGKFRPSLQAAFINSDE